MSILGCTMKVPGITFITFIRNAERSERQILLGTREPKGIDRRAKIGYGYHC
jgi:hypothetical protein